MKNNGSMELLMGGNAISMNVPSDKDATTFFNSSTDKATKSFQENIDKEIEHSKKVKEAAVNLEILPTNGNVLVRMYDKNPWEQIKVTESGLVLPVYDGSYVSKETGEREYEDLAIKFAEVIGVGPDVKYISVGDDIVFRNHTQLPVPFLGQSLWVVSQNNILVVINEDLAARFSKLKEK